MVELRPNVDYRAIVGRLDRPLYLLKMCNRCRGDFYLDKDRSGDSFLTCTQCGNLIELDIPKNDGQHASRAYHQRRPRPAL